MELNGNYGYEQVLELVKQLPLEDERKLKEEMEKDIVMKSSGKKIQFGDMKGKIWMSDDFDAPLEDFKDYM